MRKIFAIAMAVVVLATGCDSSTPADRSQTPDRDVYTADPAPRRIPTTSKTEDSQPTTDAPAPDHTDYQRLNYGSAYRLVLDGGNVSVLVSEPSSPAVTDSGTEKTTFVVTVRARTDWNEKSARLSFDSNTSESFWSITNSGPDPLTEDISAGETEVYKMILEAPAGTYKTGSITLRVSGKKIATWS